MVIFILEFSMLMEITVILELARIINVSVSASAGDVGRTLGQHKDIRTT